MKDSLATLGFLALPGGLFAAPADWKPAKKPNLVFGILSDTHLQSGWDGVTPHGGFPLTYVTNAMKLFRERNIDAFMHLGDAAHRGKNVEAQYHRDIFDKFFPHGKAKDGHKVEKWRGDCPHWSSYENIYYFSFIRSSLLLYIYNRLLRSCAVRKIRGWDAL